MCSSDLDYINKNGFPGAIIGLSGGIDSALTLAIAVDALGADRVRAVMMPSQYTADMSREDAEAEAAERIARISASVGDGGETTALLASLALSNSGGARRHSSFKRVGPLQTAQ